MKLLETTRDLNGIEMQVYSGEVSGSPAFSSLLRAYAELLDSNLASPHFDFVNEDFMLWIQYTDGTILGGMCFGIDSEWDSIELKMGWTEKEYRSMGINTLCHKWLEVEAKDRNLRRIISMVHVKNEMRLRSAAKVGLNPLFYLMYKKVI
jgi:GNAT superfamily N-acetyltransferase